MLEDTQLTDDEAAEDVGKLMQEAKQKMKSKVEAGGTVDAASDEVTDTALSGLEDDAQASVPATARSMPATGHLYSILGLVLIKIFAID